MRIKHTSNDANDSGQSSNSLQWRHNGHDGISNHQPYDCLLNRLFRRRSKKTSKLRVTGLSAGNSPGTGEFLAQMASSAENLSIRWRHHLAKAVKSTTCNTSHNLCSPLCCALFCHSHSVIFLSLQWRHNGHDGASNYQPHHCLLSRLFGRRSKQTSKLRVTDICAGIHRGPVNSPHKWPATRRMFPLDDVCIMKPVIY